MRLGCARYSSASIPARAEFASPTAYMYSTYESPFAGSLADESAPSDKTR